MRKIIYNNIDESEYYSDYDHLRFYFSSELYRDKFNSKFKKYIIDEMNKLRIKYKCLFHCDEMLALCLYQKIEKRGFRVIEKESNRKLGKDYIIESNIFDYSYMK